MAIKLGDKTPLVRKWQKFLVDQGFLKDSPDGDFGPKTLAATKDFQNQFGLKADGVAGSATLGKAFELGFNPDNEPTGGKITGTKGLLKWIKDNLGLTINNAISGTIYTEDWLASMCARETGFLIIRYFNQGYSFEDICVRMKGDYRKSEGRYRGFGFWQIDVGSFPQFTNSEKWKDPVETAKMAVKVLEEKRKYLESKGWKNRLSNTDFERAITAAYNCGQGNVDKALSKGLDIDYYTYQKDYSSEVFRNRAIYRSL